MKESHGANIWNSGQVKNKQTEKSLYVVVDEKYFTILPECAIASLMQ